MSKEQTSFLYHWAVMSKDGGGAYQRNKEKGTFKTLDNFTPNFRSPDVSEKARFKTNYVTCFLLSVFSVGTDEMATAVTARKGTECSTQSA